MPVAADIQWATDANFTNGVDAGTPTKVEPSVGVKAEGHVPGTPLPAQRLNWHLNAIGEVIADLEGTITLSPAVARSTAISLAGASPETAAGVLKWERGETAWTALANNSQLHIPMPRLPSGAEITSVDLMILPAAARAGTNRMKALIRGSDYGSSNPVLSGDFYDSGAASLQTVTLTPTTTLIVNNSTMTYRVQLVSGLTSTVSDLLLYARVNWLDPGLRSY